MNKIRVWASYGLGGTTFDPLSGERQLVARCKAAGFDVRGSPYQWNDIQAIVDDILRTPEDIKKAVGGDSLGANEAPAIAAALAGKRDIDLLFGFQRSQYGVQVDITPNVIKAVNVYNPVWIETLGLGDDPWTRAAGNTRTILRTIPLEVAHPDDWGQAQDIAFSYIKALAA